MTAKEILELADPRAIVWDGFDHAIIGTDVVGRLVYDVNLMIETLMTEDEISEQDAIEYLEYNTLNTYVGNLTPVHVYIQRK